MQISFYVLSESKAQDLLGFICQLTQTALNKSNQSLLILAEEDALLGTLDEALWAHDASSFIPHQRLNNDSSTATDNTADTADTADTATKLAPVLLSSYMPIDFDGIVLNITPRPVNDFMAVAGSAHPTRVLELIKPDAKSMQDGRNKYKHYQQLEYQLTHFKV